MVRIYDFQEFLYQTIEFLKKYIFLCIQESESAQVSSFRGISKMRDQGAFLLNIFSQHHFTHFSDLSTSFVLDWTVREEGRTLQRTDSGPVPGRPLSEEMVSDNHRKSFVVSKTILFLCIVHHGVHSNSMIVHSSILVMDSITQTKNTTYFFLILDY